MPRIGNGVEVRDTSIRLSFTDHTGKACRETLYQGSEPLSPTPPNVRHAHRIAEEIRRQLRAGSFTEDTYREYFPQSRRAKSGAGSAATFGKLCDLWLDSKGTVSEATRYNYLKSANFWKKMFGEGTPLTSLTHAEIAAKIGKYPWPSAKHCNNHLIALRGVMGLEYRGKKAAENPMIGIENRPVIKRPPDPLTPDERDRILADLHEHYPVQVAAYFKFAFFTGMRPEEMIALRWSDIDWQRKTARVQRVRTFKGSERDGSKTHAIRDVDLATPALEALSVMKPLTFLVGKADSDVFQNPVTRQPWHDERSQRDHYWRPALKRLGIRWRRAYATRHTYCTALLMAGVQPAYIAKQAGHSLKMLLEVYSRWIDEADKGRERAKLEAAFSGSASSQSRVA